MKEKQNKKILSRRGFFKKAAKKVLPIIALVGLTSVQPLLAAGKRSNDCSDCTGNCQYTCEGTCGSSCEKGCYGTCEGSCEGSCTGGCGFDSCQGGCYHTCTRSGN